MFLQANLRNDSTTKPLLHRCQDLTVFGSLDGILGGWNLRLLQARSHEYNIALDGLLTLNLALNPFEFFMFNFAYCLITPKGSSTDSAYFVLVDMYLKYFLPSEGSVPPRLSPTPEAPCFIIPPPPPLLLRSTSVSFSGYGVHSPSLLKHHIFQQPSVNADPAAQEIWRCSWRCGSITIR
ncbi:hypothetical protein F7725_016364 [Dissostichus mawsoni]|uniref:Uncharacterized protein n=1 Tax=Dissostichus mawsoni TaxID=36200 RepID=A0A7J5Z3D9_DISMA|nr:hypothetical protein F7725_016364 [Dissostichus mawsoni]